MDIIDTKYICIKDLGGHKAGNEYVIYPTCVDVLGKEYNFVTSQGHLLSDEFLDTHFEKLGKKKDMFQAIKDIAFEVGNESTQVTYERLSDVHDYIGEHEITITWRDETPYITKARNNSYYTGF
ncbi:hypothetical protein [Staphylococcus sp. LCT-H4]|uniref:hypothetical protein n=1 Tax=Staphylococcus sp. LCT-H4 TaxID=1914308 RepID=UPI0008F4E456|nr:hypothetical protein [Staphylococcus sp. LCT-H4]OIJ29036.1 hypothetical protein BK821_12350 [Staphylococcus sp. LCT-H4]